MKYLGRISDPKDLVTKEYVDNAAGSGSYNDLTNKPQINNVTLSGNKTPAQLGLAPASHSHSGTFTPEVEVTGASYTPAGSVSTPTITVTPTTTNIKATASGTAVGADGTATVLTGVKASGTATFVKSYPGATSKLATTSVGSASGWSAGSLPSLGTAISADDITAWSAGSHSANIQPNVLIGASVSDGTLTISTGTQSHSFTAPSLSYTERIIPNVTGVGTLPSLTVSSKTVATGSLAADATGATVMTGLGTASTETGVTGVAANGTATALTGVKVTAQPAIALATGATAGTGVISVATGISSASSSKPTFTGTTATITPTVEGVEGTVTVS